MNTKRTGLRELFHYLYFQGPEQWRDYVLHEGGGHSDVSHRAVQRLADRGGR